MLTPILTQRSHFSRARRVIVKVGTGVISSPTGGLSTPIIRRIVKSASELLKEGKEVIIVSSGAIGAGFPDLGLKERPKILPLEQAASAIGQIKLISEYDRLFRKFGHKCAQILLTREDIEERERFLNARNTFFSLLKRKIVPVVNENDSVATDEIRYGDNDILSAMVTILVEGDILIILTDRKGLLKPPVEKNEVVSEVKEITSEIKKMASSKGKGKGGMESKVKAAEILTRVGIPVIVADGREKDIIIKILKGEEVGTFFVPKSKEITGRKYWIAYLRKVKGKIQIDEGAKEAILLKGKSLLPTGIVGVEGKFYPGDTVSVVDLKGEEVARGLVNYSWEMVEKIMGKNTNQIREILKDLPYEEVIHRDNMVLSR